MVTSGFAKFFPSVWFRSQPLHLAEGTSLGVSARGRRWEAAGGRWETGARSLQPRGWSLMLGCTAQTSCPLCFQLSHRTAWPVRRVATSWIVSSRVGRAKRGHLGSGQPPPRRGSHVRAQKQTPQPQDRGRAGLLDPPAELPSARAFQQINSGNEQGGLIELILGS